MADVTTSEVTLGQTVPAAREARAASAPEMPRRSHKWILRYALFAAGGAALCVGGMVYWLSGGRYVESTDAYVQANVLDVSTDVAGLVQQIRVHEGEAVQQDQVLFTLDPLPFQLMVDAARAQLAQSRLDLAALQSDYVRGQRQVAMQRAQVESDQATFDRYAALVGTHAIARERYDDTRFKLLADQAAMGASTAQMNVTLARLGGDAGAAVTAMPAYQLAAARLGEAERALRHATVRAAFSGVVTEVNKLAPGQYLAAGTPAFGLVNTRNLWITSQPKETALTWARVGQAAAVTVDAFPGHVWSGTVQSIAPATDQEFAVLPAQNSSGNWVKVVQRVPLRVAINLSADDPPLAAGMSAGVSIDTHHIRSFADLF